MRHTTLVSKEVRADLAEMCNMITRPKFEEKIREENYITKEEMILHIMNLLKDCDNTVFFSVYNEIAHATREEWVIDTMSDVNAVLDHYSPKQLLEEGKNGNFYGSGEFFTQTSFNEFFGITDFDIVEE